MGTHTETSTDAAGYVKASRIRSSRIGVADARASVVAAMELIGNRVETLERELEVTKRVFELAGRGLTCAQVAERLADDDKPWMARNRREVLFILSSGSDVLPAWVARNRPTPKRGSAES